MQLGTTNTSADFQEYIKYKIREALDDFASAYLDDILLNSHLEEKHVQHDKWIIQWLFDTRLYLKLERFEFHTATIRH
jgi:hypothetical protein